MSLYSFGWLVGFSSFKHAVHGTIAPNYVFRDFFECRIKSSDFIINEPTVWFSIPKPNDELG
jgi:hypothetical protein